MVVDGQIADLALGAIIPATDGMAIAEFERVRPAILEILEETGAGPCWFLTAARLDCPKALVAIPTILLLCSNPKNCRLELKAIDTELRIVVAMGAPAFRAIGPHNTAYYQRVHMGGSIGVKGVLSSGTLGGYIFDPITKNRYGLTNGHVVAMNLKGRMSAMPVVVTESEQLVIVQNSDEDYALMKKDKLEILEQAVAVDEIYGGAHPRCAWKRVAAQREFAKFEQIDRELGIVKFGHMGIVDSETRNYKCWKDIGVVDVKPGNYSLWYPSW